MTASRGVIRPRWKPTPDQVDQLRRRFPTTKTAVLAAEFGVAYHQVARLARQLGVLKDPAWLAGPEGGRTGTDSRGMGTRFQPGHPTWIAGKRLPGYGNPATQFKAGHMPKNWKPIGSLRVACGGYLQIKLTDTGYPPRDWVMYHRHVWERDVGPIPAGHSVAFRNGQRLTDPGAITVEQLELVSRAEMMRRNTFHQYGPEIAHTVILRAAITRQIRKRQDKDQHDE
ncbi:MAG: HNH endonuclease signature motif containing protein [Betaproteobacteria bacterium]